MEMRPLPTVKAGGAESARGGFRFVVLSTQDYVDSILSRLWKAEAVARAEANPLR